jgi:beta-galactosidase
LNYGKIENSVAVRADMSAQPASRWYSGAGIYRHVRLVMTEPVHIAEDGVFVTTPKVSAAEATVKIETSVTNETDSLHNVTVQTMLLAPDGKFVKMIVSDISIPNSVAKTLQQQIILPNPRLWNLDQPALYHVATKILAEGKSSDDLTTAFGIRDAHFEAEARHDPARSESSKRHHLQRRQRDPRHTPSRKSQAHFEKSR